MRIGLDGQPLRSGIVNAQVGVIHTAPEDENTLVILDADTQEQIHVPLKNEQMERLYQDWTDKHVQPASVDQMQRIVRSNGHLNGG